MLNVYGIVEDVLVEVGRAVEHHHPLALLDLHAGQLGVLECGALERGDRRGPPDDLVGGGRWPLALEQLPLVREFGERHHALRDRVSGGLVSRHRQQDDEEAELVVGELVPLDICLDQLGDEVVAGVLAALGGHLHPVHDQFDRCGRRVVPGELRVLVADHLVRPVEQLLAVFLRHPHQAGDRLQRKFAGHLFDEIA